MSRIDEALRRAAEEEGTAPVATAVEALEPVEPVNGADATALAREPFPVELAERPHAEARATDGSTEASNKGPSLTEEESRDSAPKPKNGRLFERIDARLAEKVVADENMSGVSREQYRRLAAVLHDAQMNSGIRVIMIASAVPSEGKTLTATNLALTLSESYRNRVLLIDADLRRPTLHHVFRLKTSAGLIEGLEASRADTKLVLRQVSDRLSVLPAGRPTSDPMAALTSDRMRRLIDEAKETFEWVILDTPPLMLLPDAHLLSALVDGAVLIIKAGSTPHEQVKRAADIIGRDRITGVVLNQANSNPHGYGTYYTQGYYLHPPKAAEGP